MLKSALSPMKIAIGADHAGFVLKQCLAERLRAAGHDVQDVGTNSPESTDYPDYAAAVARAVSSGEAERGVLVCFTGMGMTIAANKYPGIRAALAVSPDVVRLARDHNNANVLALGASFTSEADAAAMVTTFLETSFSAAPRHCRRIEKIADLEQTASAL